MIAIIIISSILTITLIALIFLIYGFIMLKRKEKEIEAFYPLHKTEIIDIDVTEEYEQRAMQEN